MPLLNVGETAGPVIMFLIPIAFYVALAVTGTSFDEVPAHSLQPAPCV